MNKNINIIKSIKKYPIFSFIIFLNILFFLSGIVLFYRYSDKPYAVQMYFFMTISVVLSAFVTFIKDVLNKKHKVFDYLNYIIILSMLFSLWYLSLILKGVPSL